MVFKAGNDVVRCCCALRKSFFGRGGYRFWIAASRQFISGKTMGARRKNFCHLLEIKNIEKLKIAQAIHMKSDVVSISY